jgi:hypothetical protein
MVVGPAVFAVDLLRPHHLRCDAVGVVILILTCAWLDKSSMDPKEFQILPLIIKIFSETYEQFRKKSLR